MQIIHRTSEAVGSFDWEIPEQISTILEAIAPEARKVLLDQLGNMIENHLNLLMAAACMGSLSGIAFQMINDEDIDLSEILLNMSKIGPEEFEDP